MGTENYGNTIKQIAPNFNVFSSRYASQGNIWLVTSIIGCNSFGYGQSKFNLEFFRDIDRNQTLNTNVTLGNLTTEEKFVNIEVDVELSREKYNLLKSGWTIAKKKNITRLLVLLKA